jgi:hypothetical protein
VGLLGENSIQSIGTFNEFVIRYKKEKKKKRKKRKPLCMVWVKVIKGYFIMLVELLKFILL